MTHSVIPDLFLKYIKGTEKEAIVQNVQVLVCDLTSAVVEGIGAPCNRVYISTRALKHVYDKRPAEEFDFLIENVPEVIRYPKYVYKNKDAKKGNYCFVLDIKNNKYLCSIQVIKDTDGKPTHCEVVTFFRNQKESYLANYDLLWEWKGGEPSS